MMQKKKEKKADVKETCITSISVRLGKNKTIFYAYVFCFLRFC
jgi:hypothetical protein